MNLDDYQAKAARTASTAEGQVALAVAALGIAGEAGEVADLVKKHVGHGHPLEDSKFLEELGDVLWYVAVLAWMRGVPLSRVAQRNVDKLLLRYPQGFSTLASMNRPHDTEGP